MALKDKRFSRKNDAIITIIVISRKTKFWQKTAKKAKRPLLFHGMFCETRFVKIPRVVAIFFVLAMITIIAIITIITQAKYSATIAN
jgi:chromate transport protein ChrA